MRSVLIVSVLTMCVLTRWAEIVSVLIISSRIASMRRGGVAPGRALAKGKRVRRTRRQIFLRKFPAAPNLALAPNDPKFAAAAGNRKGERCSVSFLLAIGYHPSRR